MQYKVTLPKGQEVSKIKLEAVVFNTKMSSVTISASPPKNDSDSTTVQINSASIQDKFYRFGFKVTTTGKANEAISATITVSDVVLDDFCAFGDVLEVDKCKKHGDCLVNLNVTNLKYECKCIPGYTGSDCGTLDYCTGKITFHDKTGNDVCQANKDNGKCINQNGQFVCDCNENQDKVWMPIVGK